jgi:hypothetical protein
MNPEDAVDRFTPEAMRALIDQDPDTGSELRAAFETWLTHAARDHGLGGVRRRVMGLNALGYDFQEVGATETSVRFSSPLPGVDRPMEVEASRTHSVASAHLSFPSNDEPPAADPRHERFYAAYEGMIGMPESQIPDLDATRRAVFLVGLLEAELNNGGFGQYLMNTEGALLEQTLEVLEQIDAPDTYRQLGEVALLLRESGVDPSDAWDDLGAELEELDDEFLLAAEDLAGAVIDVFDPPAP